MISIYYLFQIFFKILFILLVIKSTWLIRRAVESDGAKETIFYMTLVDQFTYAALPLVIYRNYYMNFKEIDTMLETVGRCSLLQNSTQNWVKSLARKNIHLTSFTK